MNPDERVAWPRRLATVMDYRQAALTWPGIGTCTILERHDPARPREHPIMHVTIAVSGPDQSQVDDETLTGLQAYIDQHGQACLVHHVVRDGLIGAQP